MADNLDMAVVDAIALLPPVGQTVEFNAYKSTLYAANPDGGKDVFARMIKAGLVNKKLSRNSAGEVTVLLSRKE